MALTCHELQSIERDARRGGGAGFEDARQTDGQLSTCDAARALAMRITAAGGSVTDGDNRTASGPAIRRRFGFERSPMVPLRRPLAGA